MNEGAGSVGRDVVSAGSRVRRSSPRGVGAIASAACCVAFGIAALRDPGRMGRRCGLDVDTTRVMGIRDVVVGCLIAAHPSPTVLAARAVVDVGDAALLVRRRPAIAALAGAFGLMNAVLATRSEAATR